MSAQTWTVLEWGTIDGGILGALIRCPFCESDESNCSDAFEPSGCSGSGVLFKEYELPNGAPIDLHRDAEILIQIEPPISPEPEAA